MRRRQFIGLLGAGLTMPMAVYAEPKKLPRIGVLWHAGNEDEEREYFSVLMQAFNELGYIEGKTAEFMHRYPAERPERFDALAKELVDARPDVIIAVNSRCVNSLKPLTRSIPIVFVLAADPVGAKVVDSLAHPGGNMTGLSLMLGDLSGKRLALLKEALPALRRVAFVVDPKDPNSQLQIGTAKKTAETLGVTFGEVPAANPEAIDAAFTSIANQGFEAAMVAGSMFFNERVRVGRAALARRIPTMTMIAEMVPYGLLMSYGPDFPEFFRRSAAFADRILKGAPPADLPVEQPTRFKFVINLKVAKQLELGVPPSLLVAADETID